MKKILSFLIAAMLVAAALSGCGNSGNDSGSTTAANGESGSAASQNTGSSDSIVIKVAHGATEDHSTHIGWLKFKEVVEEKSGGTMTVEIYPNQQLGGDSEVVQGTQLGNITAGHSSTSPVASFASEFYVLDAPYMFNSREEVYEMLDGEAGDTLMTYLENIGLKGLGYTENGFRSLTTNTEIKTPDDLKGLKVRVMENNVQMLIWSTWGANPTPVAFGELFTALQQKTVDAQENPLELINTNKFYEVQDYLILTEHIYSPIIMFMNLDFYNSLTADQQPLLKRQRRLI